MIRRRNAGRVVPAGSGGFRRYAARPNTRGAVRRLCRGPRATAVVRLVHPQLRDEAPRADPTRGGKAVEHRRGDEIVRQGDPGAKLYLVRRGRVDVVVVLDGSERVLNVLADGDFFGEIALLTGDVRDATVRAATTTDLYSLDRADFLELLEREPTIKDVVSRTVAERRAGVVEARRVGAHVVG
ncbi:MAG: cyclic nucleotide-binding domain-containing protein [Gaiellaceae bacterium]